jgi:hypothetical protein
MPAIVKGQAKANSLARLKAQTNANRHLLTINRRGVRPGRRHVNRRQLHRPALSS